MWPAVQQQNGRDVAKHCGGAVMPPGVLTSHQPAELCRNCLYCPSSRQQDSTELPCSWACVCPCAQALAAVTMLPSSPALGQLLRTQCELEPLSGVVAGNCWALL